MTVINFKLSKASILEARKEVLNYKAWVEKKSRELENRLADELRATIEANFASTWYNDRIRGEGKEKPVARVEIHDNGKGKAVITYGEGVIWVEFGAGVYYNGSVGNKPNPYGEVYTKGIGQYGYGLGANKVWFYEDDGGTVHRTRGTEAQMPIFKAVTQVRNDILRIAHEVFSSP